MYGCQTGAAGKVQPSDLCKRIRQHHLCQANTVLEDIGAQVSQGLRQLQGGHIFAALESIVPKTGNTLLHHNGGDGHVLVFVAVVIPGLGIPVVPAQGALAGNGKAAVGSQDPGNVGVQSAGIKATIDNGIVEVVAMPQPLFQDIGFAGGAGMDHQTQIGAAVKGSGIDGGQPGR